MSYSENSASLQPITENHKKLAFAFMRVMHATSLENAEGVEDTMMAIGNHFGVDPAGVSGSHDSGVDLLSVFANALREHDKAHDKENDEKFNAFVSVLEKKGYFKDIEKGSEEYQQRLNRAREKFNQRNNPFEGLTAEQIKNKGNELMGQTKYKDAIVYYTKAIEMQPENCIFFCNRAAAHTHLQDYTSAVVDAERAISLNPSFSKAYSRLGTALFYQENYPRAVEAFSKACELDPSNATYKSDLERAQQKNELRGGSGVGGSGANINGGFGGFGNGFPDMSQLGAMFSNPEFMSSVQSMMQNPAMMNMMTNIASSMASGSGGAGGFNPMQMMNAFQGSGLDPEGNIVTPMGTIPKEKYEEFKEEYASNPVMLEAMQDIEANGMGAMQKYMNNPEFMRIFTEYASKMMGAGQQPPSA